MGSGWSTAFRSRSRRPQRTSATSGRRSLVLRICSKRRWSMGLEHGDDLVGDDGIALDDPDLLHDSILRRRNLVLHLHRLQDEEGISAFVLDAGAGLDPYDAAGHGRMDRQRSGLP